MTEHSAYMHTYGAAYPIDEVEGIESTEETAAPDPTPPSHGQSKTDQEINAFQQRRTSSASNATTTTTLR